jgi:hypothetical protein
VTGAQTINVTVTITRPTILLSAIGIDHVQVTKTATADLVQGVTGEDDGFMNSEGLFWANPRVVRPGG